MNKLTEPLRNTPQSITVIPKQMIQDMNATTLRDVLRYAPASACRRARRQPGRQPDDPRLQRAQRHLHRRHARLRQLLLATPSTTSAPRS
jgi:hypothetical protein